MNENQNGQSPGIWRFLFPAMIFLSVAMSGFAQETDNMEFDEETIFILEEIDDILETTVVTASRTGTTLGKSTRSIALITREDMESAQNYHIPKMADRVAGIFTRPSGGMGQLTHIMIRGISDDYTQMQYNGIPLKDPSDIYGSLYYSYTNFYSGLNLDNIEILKGVNSTLYGSQAVGGVVNIAPERWTDGFFYESRSEFGEHNTLIKHEHLSYGDDDFYTNISAHLIDTNGDNNGGEDDFYYENKGFFANTGKKIGKDISLEFHAIHYDAKAPMTSVSQIGENGEIIPNTASQLWKREYRMNQAAVLFSHYLSPKWDYIFKVAYTESILFSDYSISDPGGYGDVTNNGKNSGETYFVELQNNFYPTAWLSLVAGIDYEHNRKHGESLYSTDDYVMDHENKFKSDVWDLFVLCKTNFFDETLMLDAGFRYSDHQTFDPELSWEISGVYIFESTDTRIRGHVGTGYRLPSLSEMSLSATGHEPETAMSYDLGIEQFFMKKKIKLGATWFRIEIDDKIFSSYTDTKNDGVEGFFSLQPWRWFKFGASFTYLENKGKTEDGEWEKDTYQYLPDTKINCYATFYPISGITANVSVLWMDEVDVGWVQWPEDDPVIVNAALTYRLSDNTELWIRAENLFDEEYTRNLYTMPGQWMYAGVKFAF